MTRPGTGRALLAGAWLSASLLASGESQAVVSSGLLITNFISATFSLASGDGMDETETGVSSTNCGVPTATAWVIVTDTPRLCMTGWKRALLDGNGTPLPPPGTRAPGDFLCYEVGFSNCGDFTGFSVTITDILPANVVKSPSQPGTVWVSGGAVTITPVWASILPGPWYVITNAGQTAPLYMRWLLGRVGMHKTGYVRYCVTVL